MNKAFKVLSIDFDFFQDTTLKALTHYPDGCDYSTQMSEAIWAARYKTNAKELLNVQINKSLYQTMIQILKAQNSNVPVLITRSHKDAYGFIKGFKKVEWLDLVNVDLHHDITNQNKELDCGNWIRYAIQDFKKVNFRWIARKVSVDTYEIEESEQKDFHMSFGLSPLLNEKFDAIFLCRSDAWLPPHLDTYFDEMKKVCVSRFEDASA